MPELEKSEPLTSIEIPADSPSLPFDHERHTREHAQQLIRDGVLRANQVKARLAKDGERVLCGYGSCGYVLGNVHVFEQGPEGAETSTEIPAVQLEAGMAPVNRRKLSWRRSMYAARRAATGRTLKNRSYPEQHGEINANSVMTNLFESLPQVVKCPKCKFLNQLWPGKLSMRLLCVMPARPSHDPSR